MAKPLQILIDELRNISGNSSEYIESSKLLNKLKELGGKLIDNKEKYTSFKEQVTDGFTAINNKITAIKNLLMEINTKIDELLRRQNQGAPQSQDRQQEIDELTKIKNKLIEIITKTQDDLNNILTSQGSDDIDEDTRNAALKLNEINNSLDIIITTMGITKNKTGGRRYRKSRKLSHRKQRGGWVYKTTTKKSSSHTKKRNRNKNKNKRNLSKSTKTSSSTNLYSSSH
jgi:small-conductance mechanosensitive channel